jgi:hypothetical protein
MKIVTHIFVYIIVTYLLGGNIALANNQQEQASTNIQFKTYTENKQKEILSKNRIAPIEASKNQKIHYEPLPPYEIKKYSINLMWLNSTLEPKYKYINNSRNEEDLREKLLRPLVEWKKANPDTDDIGKIAEVNFWYDSKYTTETAINNTKKELSKYISSNPNISEYQKKYININFQDIRKIPIVKNNPDVFSNQVPLYFRIDILKAIIVVYEIEIEKKDAAIFSDLEVGDLRPNKNRMNKEELFGSEEVLTKYISAGLTLGAGKPGIDLYLNGIAISLNSLNIVGYPENQFFQLMANPKMIEAIKHTIINANLMRAAAALNYKKEKKDDGFLRALTSSAVFKSTCEDALNYYMTITEGKQIMVRPDIVNQGQEFDPWIPYIPEKHGYAIFGHYYHDTKKPKVYTLNSERLDTKNTIPNDAFFETYVRTDEIRARFMRKVDVRSPGLAYNIAVEEGQPDNGVSEYSYTIWDA